MYPAEDLFFTGRGDPVERLVTASFQDIADPVAAVGADGEIFHPAVCQGRNNGPRPSGNVGDHRRGQINAAFPRDPPAGFEQAVKLFRPAKRRQFVGKEPVQFQPAGFNSLLECKFLLRVSFVVIRFNSPHDFRAPFHLRPGRKIFG
jgi:hypothetical protein